MAQRKKSGMAAAPDHATAANGQTTPAVSRQSVAVLDRAGISHARRKSSLVAMGVSRVSAVAPATLRRMASMQSSINLLRESMAAELIRTEEEELRKADAAEGGNGEHTIVAVIRIFNKKSETQSDRAGVPFSRDDIRMAQAHARLIAAASSRFEDSERAALASAMRAFNNTDSNSSETLKGRKRGSLLALLGIGGRNSGESSGTTGAGQRKRSEKSQGSGGDYVTRVGRRVSSLVFRGSKQNKEGSFNNGRSSTKNQSEC